MKPTLPLIHFAVVVSILIIATSILIPQFNQPTGAMASDTFQPASQPQLVAGIRGSGRISQS